MRIVRLFTMLDLLRARTVPVTAEWLAAELRVSLRTVYRDIASLQGLGAPIRGEAGVGYQMEKGFFMPSLSFGQDELESLLLGARLVMARGDDALAAAAHRAAGKIASALHPDVRERFLEMPLEAGPVASAPGQRARLHLAELRAAIRDRAMLEIEYTDLKGVMSRRLARPLGLTAFDAVWLLTVWSEANGDFRHLRVDRVLAFRRTGATFRHEKGKRFADALSREKARAMPGPRSHVA